MANRNKSDVERVLASLNPESMDQLCDLIVAKLAERGLGMPVSQARRRGFESLHPLFRRVEAVLASPKCPLKICSTGIRFPLPDSIGTWMLPTWQQRINIPALS